MRGFPWASKYSFAAAKQPEPVKGRFPLELLSGLGCEASSTKCYDHQNDNTEKY
jgi:hypothetical protein